MEAVFDFINERFEIRAGESLADLAGGVQLHAGSLLRQAEWVYEHRTAFLTFLARPGRVEALVTFTVEHVKRFVYARNPYLDLGAAARRQLRGLYRRYYQGIADLIGAATSREQAAADLCDLTMENLALVGRVLQAQADAYTCGGDIRAAYYQTAVGSEYSADVQLERLGVELSQLREPVLDLGCGTHATLCSALRDAGVDAVGIDRGAPDLPYCRRVGWEDFDIGAGVWGTVLSHQAFSTHFLFHHRHSEGQSLAMAHTMMAILRSLRPGGSFVYTPGLPFMEPLLAGTGLYRVVTVPLLDLPADLAPIGYAAHISRLVL